MQKKTLDNLIVGRLLATIAALAMLTTPTTAQDGGSTAAPCSSEHHQQFDFWIGEWVVSAEGQGQVGTNRIEKTLNGCVLTEDWQGASGSIGKSFNMYFSGDRKWHQTWVDGAGSRLDLAGGWKKDAMVLSGSMPGQDGKPVLHEISWTPRPDGTVVQHWRASKDRGKNWQDLFVGIYTRAESE